MRQKVAALMILLCVLLSGCREQKNHMQQALDFRTKLLSSKGCEFQCLVEADYGEKAYAFSLDCSFDGKDGKLVVIAPEEIAGIAATVNGEDASLSFDGYSLQFGKLAGGHIAPLTIPWLLGSAWAEDYVAQVGREEDSLRVTFLKGYREEELSIDTWLQNDIPTYAEVSYNGQRMLTISIREFKLL